MAKGYVDNDVIEDLQSLVHKLEKKTRRKKKQPPKRNMNPISSYFHEKASTSHRKTQDGSDDDSHDDLDDDDVKKKVNVICLPTKHQGVHKNSFRNVRAFHDQIGIWKCWFLRRGQNRSTRRKTYRSREENKQQTQPTYDAGSGNRTRDTLVGDECSHNCAIPAPQ